MTLALGHPAHGYYMCRDPFGARGDFITAPEVSQIFGELIGIWCAAGFQMMGAPQKFTLLEFGPGRGTLMSDLLRAAKVMPGFMDAAEIHLVETSPLLTREQKIKLKNSSVPVTWHQTLDTVPELPTIMVANELFDALPIRQLQLTADGWRERMIGLEDDELKIGVGEKTAAPDFSTPTDDVGAIAETSTPRIELANALGTRIANHGGCGLIVDYGHTKSTTGDTLQAMSKHGYVDILERPGHCDVTSHVDFETLGKAFETGGSKTYGPVPQGPFLHAMGLEIRGEKLRKKAKRRQVHLIDSAVERLAARNQMGELFKVMAVTHPDSPMPAPFEGLTS